MLEKLKQIVAGLHSELPANELVRWTGGNVSGRDAATGYVVIKPSGVVYPALNPDNMVVLDPDGKIIEGEFRPSTDAASHLYIYRQRPDVFGIVHTHSPYATAFAALGRPIPCVLTAMADEFGGAIPCARYAAIDPAGNDIGKAVVDEIGTSPAILLKQHGVFTVGATPTAAVKAAVMTEDVAKTVWLACQLQNALRLDGAVLKELPQSEIERLHGQYTGVYGQPVGV